MKKQLIKVLCLALVVLFALAACGGGGTGSSDAGTSTPASSSTPAQQQQGSDKSEVEGIGGISEDAELKVALSAEPAMLLPLVNESKVSAAINTSLYDTLVYWNVEKAQAEPRVAESWEWVEDESGLLTKLRFHLREDVYTSDGNQITAEDVLYSFQIIKEANGNPALIGNFLDIDNFEVEDDFTIVVRTFMPYPTLLDRIGNDMYCIIDKEATEAKGGYEAAQRDPAGVGTGKYVFEQWVDGQYITLVRNDNYWNQDDLPYYKRITFSFISDTASRAMAVESGDVDIASEVMASQVPALEGNDALTVEVYNQTTQRTFYMNCSSGPLADAKVREAIFYLLNPDAVMAISNGGYGSIAETNFSMFNPYYAAPGADYAREVNVEKAQQLLAEAGYADGFELAFMTVPTSQSVAEIVQENLRQGGITLNVELLEIGTYIGNLIQGNYETYIGSADNWDAANLLRAVDGRVPTAGALGGAQYNNAELAALIDTAYSEFDDAKRKTAYAECQTFMRDNYLCIGLCNEIRVECYKAEMTGVAYDMRGYAMYQNVRPTA